MPPPAFAFLIVLLPGIWLAGSVIAQRITRDPGLARLLTPALALAPWLLAMHVVSLVARSFWIGLPVGTVFVAVGGALTWRRWASDKEKQPKSKRQSRPSRSAKKSRPPIAWAMWISAFVATMYLVPTAFGWWFHDEISVTGHLSMTAEIQNGIYPPRHLTFPGLELRYHYGFDLLVAAVASMLRLKVDDAIDIVTLLSWGYSWCLAWAIGERLIGPRWGLATAAVVLFGGGMPVFSTAQSLVLRLTGFSSVGGFTLNPPIVSYFFQHPWTLGFPLTFATILVVGQRDAATRWRRLGTIGILLVTLSFCQVVVFACLAGALLANEMVAEAKAGGFKASLTPLLPFAAVVLVASRLHGFFVASPATTAESMLEFRLFAIGGSPGGWASWHLQTFGLLLPLGVAGLFFLARERLLIALLLGGSLVVLNTLQYRFSWDIVKFATVTSVALSFGAAASLQRLFQLRPRSFGLTAGVVATIGLLAAGLLFPVVVGFYGKGTPFKRPIILGLADELAVDWLRRNVRAGEIVYRQSPAGLGYAQWGGLPQLIWDANTYHIGVPRSLIKERMEFVRMPVDEIDREALLRQRVRWLVLGPDETVWMNMVTPWIKNGHSVIRAQFGQMTIIEILGEMPP
jgi:hypothetical protein